MRRRESLEVIALGNKPDPKVFGLPANFSVLTYIEETKALENRRSVASGWTTAFIFILGHLFAFLLLRETHPESLFWLALTAFTPLAAIIIFPIYSLTKLLIKNHIHSNKLELSFGEKAVAYVAAYADWQYTQTEAGFGYWKNLSGAAFERAVAFFFERRGGTAALTKVTGDGGVDIVLKLGSKTFWCQCKGHAKPIPVGAIRQIAGATLRCAGSATPVMFSTNGYTAPALTEAKELGVICIDGLQLTQLARKSVIHTL